MTQKNSPEKPSRREFLRKSLRGGTLLALGGMAGVLGRRMHAENTVWQIDPYKCIQCSRCSTECIKKESAVKCFHTFDMCGYCDLCSGFFEPDPAQLDTGAENQLCPTGAINRSFVEEPYFEYVIDKELCIGCAKCVKGCGMFGNGSLYLQINQDLCLNCNECSIAVVCSSQAIKRVPADGPYLLKKAH